MIGKEGYSRPIIGWTGFEGTHVEVQFKSLGALVYYISPPVNQKPVPKNLFS